MRRPRRAVVRLALFSLLAAGGAALLGLAARPAVRWMAAPFGIGAGGLVEPETLGLDIRRASAFVLPEAAAAGLLSGRATAWRKDWASPCYDSADGSLRCLPAFYVLGAFHAGALDLWQRLSAHPHALFSLPADSPAGLTHFSEVHGWDKSFWRGCDFGSCPDKRGAGALGGVAAPPGVLASPRTALWGEASGGSFTYTFSHTHSLFHTPWEKNMSACWQAGARDERHAQCFGPALAAQREADAAVGAGTGHAFQIPWLMRAVHGDRVRLIAVLRDPVERLSSAYWYWPQYRRRYGATPQGLLAYVKEALPPLQRCIAAHGLHPCAVRFEALAKDYESVYYHGDALLKGLYAAYLPGWVAAFGRERLLLLRSEALWRAPRAQLGRALRFVGLSEERGVLDEAAWARILAPPAAALPGTDFLGACGTCGDYKLANVRRDVGANETAAAAAGGGGSGGGGGGGGGGAQPRRSRIQHALLPEAEALLRGFYGPYNALLAEQTGDASFRWGWEGAAAAAAPAPAPPPGAGA